MNEKYDKLFDLPIEQVAHDLSIVRLQLLDKDRLSTTGDVVKQYLEGVEIFKNTIDSMIKPTVNG